MAGLGQMARRVGATIHEMPEPATAICILPVSGIISLRNTDYCHLTLSCVYLGSQF